MAGSRFADCSRDRDPNPASHVGSDDAPALPPKTLRSAFSLVEVTLAFGIAAFCLLAVFGLIPIGISSDQSALEQTVSAGVARAIIADLRSTPAASGTSRQFGFLIPAAGGVATGNEPQSVYLAEDGHRTGLAGSPPTLGETGSRYRANLWVTPPLGTKRTATSVRLLITWPALADPDPSAAPTRYVGSYEIITALDRN